MFDSIQNLKTVWNALEGYRENCIPEGGDPLFDEEWGEICTAMAQLAEALNIDPLEI